MRKNIIIAVLILGAVGLTVGYFIANKSHVDVLSADPVYTGSVLDFKSALDNGLESFDSTYADQVVLLNGNITQVTDKSIVLDNILYCAPDSTVDMSSFNRGEDIRVKGIIAGGEEDLIEGYIIRMKRTFPNPQ